MFLITVSFLSDPSTQPHVLETALREQLLIYRTAPKKTYVDILLSTSFMRRHSSADIKIGHIKEPLIMGEAIAESKINAASTLYEIVFSCNVGLVGSLERDFLHASPDYLILTRQGIVRDIAFTEIKCRTRIHTAYMEKQISDKNDRWIEVDAGSQMFKKYVRSIKERFQLIHQAATLQVRKGLLLIGDRAGKLIRGIWINFEQRLLESYKSCLACIYRKNFKFTIDALEQKKLNITLMTVPKN